MPQHFFFRIIHKLILHTEALFSLDDYNSRCSKLETG